MASPHRLDLTDDQREVVVSSLSVYYRLIHREAWETKMSGDPVYLDEYREKLALAEGLLTQLGSSVKEAMLPVKGPEGHEPIQPTR